MEELANTSTFKSYLFFWSGQLVSLMGSLVVQFAITWWITIITGSALYLSIGTFLYFLPMVFLTPIAGVLTDRWDRKKLIAIVDSLQSLVTVWIIILFSLGIADPLGVILINSLRGVCQAFHMPAVSAVVPTMVPKEKLSRINGVGYLFTSLIQLIGPVIGAVLMAFFSLQLILWVDVITFVIAIIPLLLIKIPDVRDLTVVSERIKETSFKRDFMEGILTIKLIPGMIILLFLDMILNFLVAPVNVLLPLYISDIHLGTALDFAFISMFLNGGMIIGGIITTLKKNWKHKSSIYFIGLMILMSLLSVLGIAPTGAFILLWIGTGMVGLILPIINTIFMTVIQTTIPPNKMGRVSSVLQSLSSAIFPIGTIIAGPLAEIIGIRGVFIYGSLIGVFVVFMIWRFTKIRHVDYDNFEVVIEKINNINLK
ncbi:MAG: MFS transporter [Promethearchaeota archaeon]|jgi:DHA3 family macrolide efflux protein-like MFS transporter